MLSRVADSLYWMSRYIERSDGMLRMLKVNYAYSQDSIMEFSWQPVLHLFTYLDETAAKKLETNPRAILQYIVTDKGNSNSVVNIVTRARENARSVQDNITKELWQSLNDYYHTTKEEWLAHWLQKDDPITILDVLIKQGLLYYGTAEITMSRGEGYSFMNIGKFLERAILSADLLNMRVINNEYDNDTVADAPYWKYLLLSIAGYELYLKTYRSGFEARNVVEQVVLNNHFPRSIIYSVTRLQRYFDRLKQEGKVNNYQQLDFMIGKLLSKVRYSTPESIISQDLHQYLLDIKKDLYAIANALNQCCFAYS
ncbi:alpha-E domain-containing protein [Niastella caeni]|uniref:Alpha-E domain-containing protein n=1 Tax=Niastella caeni TaxID=2569763 RepID=A0A4S8I3Y3_9BACT|nr:alpha-E domain-containing protein [Niastella caeni]THU41914.1 alpha-E domain-containing protein [Niastella caeni]